MKDKKLTEELSAHLDGEADDPAAIKRLLQRDADAARQHMDLARLSAHVQALKAPETHPAFVTRVMAQVQEAPAPKHGWLRVAVPVALTAAILMAAGGLYAFYPKGDPATRALMAEVREFKEADAEALEAELLRLLEASPDAALQVAGELSGSLTADIPIEPASHDVVAEAAWFDQLSQEMQSDQTVEADLNDLSPAETDALKELLVEYATEGWTT